MIINSKSTKADILAAYQAVSAAYAADRARAMVPMVDAQSLANTARVTRDEFAALVMDCYNLGRWCRKAFGRVVDELRVTVNN